ncbi:hypothetical protein CAEBREN_22148 [Caenorhabditis brenneri]|uniref:Uncharacterized protein n=1 Tax=Caenorhabditis brenneri TaxID=135651 RepID=G0NWN6_CAEBE|nr:hypothetical protein CAEBREN_22148 [Caenorhabditis brenneri]
MENPDFETSLMSHLKNEQVKNYFNRIDRKHRAHFLFNYTSFFIPMVKNYTKIQLDLVSDFLKEYTSFKNSTKVSFGNVLTLNATRYECWDMWKSQLVSSEMETMVKLVKLFEEEFSIRTCLWEVFDIRDINRLSKYWSGHPYFESGGLLAVLLLSHKHKETLQTILTETKTPSRSSYRRILKVIELISGTEEFSNFLDKVFLHTHRNFEPLWMMMKQFFEYSEDQQKNYIDIHFADSNSSLGQFFKTIVPTFVDDFDVTFLKTWEQWTFDQRLSLYLLAYKSNWGKANLPENKTQQTIEMVERVLDEKISYKDCKDSWEFKKDDFSARVVRELIGILDDAFGKMSCEPNPPFVNQSPPWEVDSPV